VRLLLTITMEFALWNLKTDDSQTIPEKTFNNAANATRARFPALNVHNSKPFEGRHSSRGWALAGRQASGSSEFVRSKAARSERKTARRGLAEAPPGDDDLA